MGTDPCPWVCWQSLQWQSVKSNYDGNVDSAPQNENAPPTTAAFSSCANHLFGFGAGGDVPPAVADARFLQRRSSTIPPHLDPFNAPSEVAAAGAPAAERRFLIFDQSGDGTSILFSSIGPPIWNLNRRSLNPKLLFDKCGIGVGDIPAGNYVPVNLSGGTGTEVSNGGGCGEMREDTEEIDALLYSDSEFDQEDDAAVGEEDEPSSMGGFPEALTASAEEVASNSVPTKRRRLREEDAVDASLMDTASSAKARYEDDAGNRGGGDDEESICAGGAREEQEPPRNCAGRGLKRPRIQETLCVLRKIIPGGKGKDDATVLDEAIRYLRSLKLKAKRLGSKLK